MLSKAACALLIALPFLSVTFPPVTDLPQQMAQVRLLHESLGGSEAYRVQALHPNKLGYLPLILGWELLGPLLSGRFALITLGGLWVVAIHALARATGRPQSMAVLASLFFFHHALYWGFLNFLIGFPVFIGWYLVVRKLDTPLRWQDGLRLLLMGFLLFSAHLLWLIAGLIWLGITMFLDRAPPAEILRRGVWLLPIVFCVAIWSQTFLSSGVDERTFWGRPPWVRLTPSWMLGALLGGLRGRLEGMVAASVLAWLLLGLWQHRHQLSRAVEPRLALAGLLFTVAVIVLPEVERHTIFFAARWAAPGAIFLVLACPPPRLRSSLSQVVPWLLLVALAMATTRAWTEFEEAELSGLEAALETLPPESRLLGLDLVRTSPRLHGFPYYHLFAYGQVLHGGELNRSFADEASSLVTFRDLPFAYPWTHGLEWRPERFRRSDRDHFDFILVLARPEDHAFFLRDPHLEPVTDDRPWRLYRVR